MTNAEGGFSADAIRFLTNIPVFSYATSAITTTAEAESFYSVMKAADDANYIMSSSTAGSGDDSQFNTCGIAMSHAYSIIAAFTMTDASGVAHKMIMVRNPWGSAYYSHEWHKNDAAWTDALVAQVPHGVDPRTD